MYDKYLKVLREKLDDFRYTHCVAVAKQAVHLAAKYGCNLEKAYLAGLLHDITKNETEDWQLRFIENCGIILNNVEKASTKLYHGISGALYIERELGIADKEIISAVRYHTTGKSDMSLLEKIIYIADYTSSDRTYPDVNILRDLVEESLDKAVLYALSYTLHDLVNKNLPVHTDTLEAYNFLQIKGGS